MGWRYLLPSEKIADDDRYWNATTTKTTVDSQLSPKNHQLFAPASFAADDVDVADGFRQLRDGPLVGSRDGDVERRGRDDHGAEEAADDEVGEPEPDEVGRQLVQIVNADELVREALEPRVDAEGDGVGPAVDEPVRGLRRRQTAALEERVEALEARGHVDARPLEAGPVEDVARRLDDDVLAARGGTGEVVLAGPGDALVGPLEGELEPHA